MKWRISNPTDFWAGIMFIALGGMFAGKAFTYKLGTTAQMGAGFFPFWLGILLFLLGAWVARGGVRSEGPALERFYWWPVVTVLVSVCIFGVLLKVLGMVAAGVVLVMGASFGSRQFKWREVVLLAIGLAVFCAVLFVAGLKLPIPVCPAMDFFDQFPMCRE